MLTFTFRRRTHLVAHQLVIRAQSGNICTAFVLPATQEDERRLMLLEENVNQARHCPYKVSGRAKSPTRFANTLGEWWCPRCQVWLPALVFHKNKRSPCGLSGYCGYCQNEYEHEYRRSLRGFIKSALGAARKHSSYRRSQGRSEAGRFSLEFDYVLDMLLQQEGRCAYSGVVLSTCPLSHWQCSIERVYPHGRGYTADNVVLIASEFQTATQWSWDMVLSLPRLQEQGTSQSKSWSMSHSSLDNINGDGILSSLRGFSVSHTRLR